MARRPMSGLLAIAASLLCTTYATAGDVTNAHLLAAMPPATESVLIIREEAIAQGSGLKEELDGFLFREQAGEDHQAPQDFFSSTGKNDLDRVLCSQLPAYEPVAHVIGGSAFRAVHGIGLGSFTLRSIWLLRKDVTPLRDKLLKGQGVVGEIKSFKVDGVQVISSEVEWPCTAGERKRADGQLMTYFAAFPTDRCVVTALDRTEIEHMVRTLRADKFEIPEKWRASLAGAKVESPVLIARKYDPENKDDATSPVNPRRPPSMRADIDSFAFALVSAKDVSFQLSGVSANPDRAVSFYRSAEMNYYILAELVWEWQTATNPKGFVADIRYRKDQETPHHASLVLLSLFGVNMAI